jgi:imidazolonepropionase-like amidohydrolase
MARQTPATLLATALAALLCVAPAFAQELTITNARIIVGNGEVIPDGSIVVRNGQIAAIGPGAPANTAGRVIDARGLSAMPGFIDAHRHVYTGPDEKQQMQALLDAGFTTVLSGGGNAEALVALRDRIESGATNGPRIIPSGTPALAANLTPDQARAEIRKLASMKVAYTGEILLTPLPGPSAGEIESLKAMLDEGRRQGVIVQVHAVSTPAMAAAVDAGIRHLVHVPNKDWIPRETAQQLAAAGTHILMAIGFGSPVFGVFADDNRPRFRDGKPWPEGIIDGVGGGKEAGYSMVNSRTLFDAGAVIGNGMDTTYDPRAGLSQELRSMNVVFSTRDMVRIMGPNTAAYLGMADAIGTLQAGKLADMVLLDGDPLEGYWNWLRARMVVKEGRIVAEKRD